MVMPENEKEKPPHANGSNKAPEPGSPGCTIPSKPEDSSKASAPAKGTRHLGCIALRFFTFLHGTCISTRPAESEAGKGLGMQQSNDKQCSGMPERLHKHDTISLTVPRSKGILEMLALLISKFPLMAVSYPRD